MNKPLSAPRYTPRYIFGPVPSRRLKRSLGVDLVPYKICTFDCIYCDLGRTTQKTEDVSKGLGLRIDEVVKYLGRLSKTGTIRYRVYQHHCYYEVAAVN